MSKVSNEIKNEVSNFRKHTKDFENATKYLLFMYLIDKKPLEKFIEKFDKSIEEYNELSNKIMNKGYNKVEELVVNIENIKLTDIQKGQIQGMLFNLDNESIKQASDRYAKIIKSYYKTSIKRADADYIKWNDYLSKKVSQYDKIEKTVAYYKKNTNEVQRYVDLNTYNSMVYNTNLTRSAFNETLREAIYLNEDLVYIEPHSYSCPICQIYQGRIYSLTGRSIGYPLLEVEMNDSDLFHPNCSHVPVIYAGQDQYVSNGVETIGEYSSKEWEAKYHARQKLQSLQLKRSRLKSDREIYRKLGNQEEVDKTNQKISKLNSSIKEQKELMK